MHLQIHELGFSIYLYWHAFNQTTITSISGCKPRPTELKQTIAQVHREEATQIKKNSAPEAALLTTAVLCPLLLTGLLVEGGSVITGASGDTRDFSLSFLLISCLHVNTCIYMFLNER